MSFLRMEDRITSGNPLRGEVYSETLTGCAIVFFICRSKQTRVCLGQIKNLR